jgi:HSP20 family protein
MAKSVNRYFKLMHSRDIRPSTRLWCPAADIYRRGDGWIVKIDLAGVKPDEIEISIEGSTLRVTGRRRDTLYGEGVAYHQLEITYSRFEKILRFPCSIDGAALRRDYSDGLLILYLEGKEDCQDETG